MNVTKEVVGSFSKSWFLEGFVNKQHPAKSTNFVLEIKPQIKASVSNVAVLQSSKTLDVVANFVQKSVGSKDVVVSAIPVHWSEEDQSLIDWYKHNRSKLSLSPYTLTGPGAFVSFVFEVRYPALWYLQVDKEIKQGPNGTRAKTGLLQRDLKCLKKHMQVFAY